MQPAVSECALHYLERGSIFKQGAQNHVRSINEQPAPARTAGHGPLAMEPDGLSGKTQESESKRDRGPL
ncbi:hypothetical protein D3C72_2358190 [compost metagenome]